jgi:hypothetical protein
MGIPASANQNLIICVDTHLWRLLIWSDWFFLTRFLISYVGESSVEPS